MNIESVEQLAAIDFSKADGLVPCIVQNGRTGEVLMLGYGNQESLGKTLETGDLWLYSRSRAQLWMKGATSGNMQRVLSVSRDCDSDAVLIRVDPRGPVCHTGARSCFGDPPTLVALADVIRKRMVELSENSYTVRLLSDANLRLKKLGEEAVELAVACNNGEKDRAAEEAADLVYHILVACKATGSSLEEILRKLDERRS
ncbi:MAG TPA: bifunctional phosphoribosyl-AMP cyclohydrolase/phosphoribosyl-ATP diphosphatase HisIE [Longimicrobiales bacterium]